MKSKGFISVFLIALLLFGTVFPLGYVFAEEEPEEDDQGVSVRMPIYDDPVEIENDYNRCNIGGAIHWVDRDNAQGMRPSEDELNLKLKLKGEDVIDATPAWHKDEEFNQWIFYFFDLPMWSDTSGDIKYEVSIGDLNNYTLTKTEVEEEGTAYFPAAFYASPRKSWNFGSGNRFAVIKLDDTRFLVWSEVGIDDQSAFFLWFDDLVRYKYDDFRIHDRPSAKFVNGEVEEEGISFSNVGGDWTIDFGDNPDNHLAFIYGSVGERKVPFTHFTETEMKTEFKATKMWEDDSDVNRPDSVEVVLTGTVSHKPDFYVVDDMALLSKDDGWTYTWTDLDRYYEGKEIDYRLSEEKVPGYVSDVGYDDDYKKCVVTNTQSIFIEGKKTWDDGDDRDLVRPLEITLLLTGRVKGVDVFYQEYTIDESDDWKWKLEVPKYRGKDEIEYELGERGIEYYQHKIEGYNITNFRDPAFVDFTVEKKWVDGESVRPEEIKVQLYANDKKLGEEVVLKGPDWKHTWKKLFVNEKGKRIKYTVKEVVPKGFTESYEEILNGIVFTNTYGPSLPSTGQKGTPLLIGGGVILLAAAFIFLRKTKK